MGDWQPHIYRTNDLGKTWKKITNGIPNDFPVRVVREDPDREGLLYAGTEYGLFVSFDDGENWQAFQQNLPVTPITDIKIHEKDLVMSTMGRGFWILDDLSALHQSFDKINNKEAYLFKPKNTYRYRYGSFRGITGLPQPEFPRPGVLIDYYLPKKQDAPLRMDILNADGKTVRTLISKPNAEEKKSEGYRNMQTEEIIYSINNNLKNEKGHHRFRWDMRHTGAWHEKENRRYGGGPMASSGIYTIKLNVDDAILEQVFELMTDPRVLKSGVKENEIKGQEKIALEIVDLISSSKKMSDKINKEIKELNKKTGLNEEEKARMEKLKSLNKKMVNATGAYPQNMYLSQLSYLYGTVNRADQLPGRDVYVRLEELKKEYGEMKKELAD